MIRVTKMNQEVVFINEHYIESIEETPDTMMTLTSGKKIIVLESCKEILEKIQKTHYNSKE